MRASLVVFCSLSLTGVVTFAQDNPLETRVAVRDPSDEAIASSGEPTAASSLTAAEIESLIEKKVAEKVAALETAKKKEHEEKVGGEPAREKTRDEMSQDSEVPRSGVNDTPGLMAPSFSKNSLTFIIGDDNLRDNSQYSPKTDVGPKDDYDSFMNKFMGYSNRAKGMTRLTLFHEDGGLLPHVTGRIGLAFDLEHAFDTTYFVKTSIYEGGSFLEVQYEKDFLVKVTAWPYDSDRMAVGFFPGLRWGTRAAWPQNLGFVPGAQALFGWGPFSMYTGFKAHLQPLVDTLGDETVPLETTYGGFGGVTYRDSGLTVSLQGAFIDKGDNVMVDESLLSYSNDDEIYSYGLDLFAEYAWGAPMGDPLGLTSFQNGAWREPDYTGDWAFRTRGEFIFLNERLQNADYLSWQETDGGVAAEPITDNFWGLAAALEASLRWKDLRLFGLASWRSLEFLVFDAPGLIPFQTFPQGAKVRDEFAGSLAIDYHWKVLWFGFSTGIKQPASYRAPGSERTTVVKDRLVANTKKVFTARNREDLPDGANPLNIAFWSFMVKAQLTPAIAASAQFSFTKDANRSKPVPDPDTGANVLFWDDEKVRDILSFFVSLEGRF